MESRFGIESVHKTQDDEMTQITIRITGLSKNLGLHDGIKRTLLRTLYTYRSYWTLQLGMVPFQGSEQRINICLSEVMFSVKYDERMFNKAQIICWLHKDKLMGSQNENGLQLKLNLKTGMDFRNQVWKWVWKRHIFVWKGIRNWEQCGTTPPRVSSLSKVTLNEQETSKNQFRSQVWVDVANDDGNG